MYYRSQYSLFRLIFQILIWGVLLWQSFYFFRTPIRELGEVNFFLHGPNLIFHEAGHVIFGLVGNDLLTAFGGTLMQCLVPLLLAIAFAWIYRDIYIARDVLLAGRVIMLLALLVGALCILGGFYRRYAAGPGCDRV